MKFNILTTLSAVLLAISANAQTATNPPASVVVGGVTYYEQPVASTTTAAPVSGWESSIKLLASDLSTATNYSADAYGTYAPSAPKGFNKIGGGVLLIYDVSSHIGVAAGIDYLGQWSMFSGNATFKLPFEPLAGWGVTNLVVIPNAIVGIGTSVSGAGVANGGAVTIAGTGGSVEFGHWLGGQFDTGVEAVNIGGAGPYSGWDYRLFVGWSKGF